ncbi:MAG: nucleotidyltransferase family protein [Polyangiales bacterium]
MSRRDLFARLANHAASEAVLRDALYALRDAGVEVMPLKGVLLRRLVYDDPAERPVGDVDLLVRGRDVRRAHEALDAAGFEPIFLEPMERERSFRHRRLGLLVDLHWQLFYDDYFDFDAEGLFARATWDEAGFVAPVWRMAPLDLYAHVLVHAGFTAWVQPVPRLYDIARIVARLHIDPVEAARHLTRCGMGAFARYALRLAAREGDGAHAGEVLAALGEDPLRDLAARAVLASVPWLRARPYLAYAPRRMLYRSGEEVAANAAELAVRGGRWARRGLSARGG